MANMIRVGIGLLVAIGFIVIFTYVLEGAFIGMVYNFLYSYVQASTLSASAKSTILSSYTFIKFAWRTLVMGLVGTAFAWFIYNIYRTESDSNLI